MWDIRLATVPAAGNEAPLVRMVNEFIYGFRFEHDVEFDQPSVRIRVSDCRGLDILIEWVDATTFRPVEILSREYDHLFGCPLGISPEWLFPGDGHPISLADLLWDDSLTEVISLGGDIEVSFDEQTGMLLLDRGEMLFSAAPSELWEFWIRAERLGPFN